MVTDRKMNAREASPSGKKETHVKTRAAGVAGLCPNRTEGRSQPTVNWAVEPADAWDNAIVPVSY